VPPRLPGGLAAVFVFNQDFTRPYLGVRGSTKGAFLSYRWLAAGEPTPSPNSLSANAYQLFRFSPTTRPVSDVALGLGIGVLLLLPKLADLAAKLPAGREAPHGHCVAPLGCAGSVFGRNLLHRAMIAPIMLDVAKPRRSRQSLRARTVLACDCTWPEGGD